jgi:hypothetical protein
MARVIGESESKVKELIPSGMVAKMKSEMGDESITKWTIWDEKTDKGRPYYIIHCNKTEFIAMLDSPPMLLKNNTPIIK